MKRIFKNVVCLRLILATCSFACAFVCLLWYFRVQYDSRNNIQDWTHFEFEGRSQDDPDLIAFISQQIIFPPLNPLPYNLEHPETKDFAINGQGEALRKIFGTKRNGFFLEAGAFNGETYSPTLFYEREMNWTGLLVEPIPEFFHTIMGKNRRTAILHAGISPSMKAQKFNYVKDGYASKISYAKNTSGLDPSKYTSSSCYPMTSILAALGNPVVDLLSLDIESFELKVLRTMDLKNLDISVIIVEFEWLPEGYEALKDHMARNGYRTYVKLYQDAIFVKEGVP